MKFLEPGSPLHHPRVVGLRFMALSLAQSAMARRYLAEWGLARNRDSVPAYYDAPDHGRGVLDVGLCRSVEDIGSAYLQGRGSLVSAFK